MISEGSPTLPPSISGTRYFQAASYLFGMPSRQFQPCIPTRAAKVPAGRDWIHEIKHDGYRLIVQRDGKRVRLFTRNGHDWSDRYPWIVDAARRLRHRQFVIDGEAVVLGVDGISDFAALYSRRHDEEVQFYAFDMLAGEGDDMRPLPLSIRKANLARLLARRSDGIFIAPFEQGEIGPDLFRRVRHGPRRAGLEASGSAIPGGAVAALDQGEEPGVASHDAGGGGGLVERQ
jgi:bifunctional non-homologous end joining protein LigD